jgi:hypothetical protein
LPTCEICFGTGVYDYVRWVAGASLTAANELIRQSRRLKQLQTSESLKQIDSKQHGPSLGLFESLEASLQPFSTSSASKPKSEAANRIDGDDGDEWIQVAGSESSELAACFDRVSAMGNNRLDNFHEGTGTSSKSSNFTEDSPSASSSRIDESTESSSSSSSSSTRHGHTASQNPVYVVVNFGGGWHHGKPSQSAGFCYVNDIVLAILKLQVG